MLRSVPLRRSPRFAAALVIALGAHALMLAASGAWRPVASVAARDGPSPVRALLVVPARHAQARPQAWAQPTDTTRAPVSPAHEPPRASAPEAWARSANERSASAAVRFYTLSEVHTPAAPLDDWNLDIDALDRLGLARLAFELLIDARGEIVECRVIDPPALASEQRADLERHLASTRMTPALRDGRPVASARRIELFIAEADPGLS